MADHIRHNCLTAVLAHCYRYDFMQLLHIIHAASSAHIDIRVRPSRLLCFPAADVREGWVKNNTLQLTVNFMGLYGVDSPMPHYFIDFSTKENNSGRCLRALLDVVNQRIYALYYLAWSRCHSYRNCADEKRVYLRTLHVLSGHCLPIDDNNVLTYANLFSASMRNAVSLAAMLQHFLGGMPVHIQQFILRWIALPRLSCLAGMQHRLADDAVLGQAIVDVSEEVQIVIGPCDFSFINLWVLNVAKWRQLSELIRRYLPMAFSATMILKLSYEKSSCLALAKDAISLGWTSWLGKYSPAVAKHFKRY